MGPGYRWPRRVCIEVADRARRERLLHYCAWPPFVLERLRELDLERRSARLPNPIRAGSGPLVLTPLELIDRIAALVRPPRIHRRRYFGVLAPHSLLRAAVTALAVSEATAPAPPPSRPNPPTNRPAAAPSATPGRCC